MKKLNAVILAALFTLVFAFAASAKPDTHRAAIEKLLAVTKQDQILDQTFTQLKQMATQEIQQFQPTITPEQKPLLEKFYTKMFDVMKEELSWNKMKEDFIQLYLSNFTEAEINDLIAFYETPSGKKYIEKTPVILKESLTITQKYTLNMMPKIQKLVDDLTAQLSGNDEASDEQPASKSEAKKEDKK